MILFYEDWEKYPNAIVHLNTKNESFIRIAKLLKHMGIKNHAFMLALHNPLLKDIDPHDPNLTLEEKLMIGEECKVNFWYYIREVARVSPPAGSQPIQFRANRANIALFWLFFNHITSYLIQPRQTGKSISVAELLGWVADLGTTNTDTSILTKDDKLRAKTSLTIREIIEILPTYLVFLTKKDVKNSEKITVKFWNNIINLYVGRTDPKAADNVGRGMTTPIVNIDEFAYIPNIDITLPVILAATTAAREVAEQQGVPYGTIFTTTAGKLNTKEGRFAYDVYKSAMRWTEHLYDCKNRKELEDVVSKNTSKLGKRSSRVVLLEFNHRQLGYTDAWLRERMSAALAEGEDAECDYLNKWLAGNMSSPLSKELLEIIRNSMVKNPNTKITEYGYVVRWFISDNRIGEYKAGKPMVIALDTSDAVGNDDIAMVIRDVETGEVLAAGNYNETNLITFADFIANLLEEFPNSVLIPERRSSAVVIIDYLLRLLFNKGINPFKKIFNWVYDEPEKYKDKYPDVFSKKVHDFETITALKKYFGFATSGTGKTSRSLLYGNVLAASAKYTGDKTRDPVLIEQISSLTVRNGRIDHTATGKDDMVIAWLLGYWFLTNSNNKQLYGINPDTVLKSLVDIEIMKEANVDKNYIIEQNKLRKEIENLFNILKKTNNEFVAIKTLNKIKQLESKLDVKVVKNFNIDAMLSELKIMKKISKYRKG